MWTGLSWALKPKSSVVPKDMPGLMPPPAIQIEKALPWWSRPYFSRLAPPCA